MNEERQAIPQFDLSSLGDWLGAIDEIVHGILFDLKCCIPAIVESYNRISGVATVRIIPKTWEKNRSGGSSYKEEGLFNVSVWRWQSGDFVIDMPIHKGATGWVIASDRDSSKARTRNNKQTRSVWIKGDEKQNVGSVVPADHLLHEYHHGFFIPARWGSLNFLQNSDGTESDAAIIARIGEAGTVNEGKIVSKVVLNKDGTIDINGGSINIVGDTIKLTGIVSIAGDTSIVGDTNVTGKLGTTGECAFGEAVSVGRGLTAGGDIVSDGDVKATDDGRSISLATHFHTVTVDGNDIYSSKPSTDGQSVCGVYGSATKDAYNRTIVATPDRESVLAGGSVVFSVERSSSQTQVVYAKIKIDGTITTSRYSLTFISNKASVTISVPANAHQYAIAFMSSTTDSVTWGY